MVETRSGEKSERFVGSFLVNFSREREAPGLPLALLHLFREVSR